MNDLVVLVLLAVRLRSRGPVAVIASTVADLNGSAVDADEVANILDAAVEAGQVRRRGEEIRHSLTPAGEAELAALLAADLDGDARAVITVGYEAFLPLNRRFLAACVAWQDHRDELDEFVELVAAVVPITDALADVRSRFSGYGPRLVEALAHASADSAWIDAHGRDSLHTVWFELHEHLLATLGRDRVSEC